MTPTTSTHGPESDNGRQDAPGATDDATEAREAIDLDAIEARAKAAPDGAWFVYGDGTVWVAHDPGGSSSSGLTGPLAPWAHGAAEHIAGMDPATTLALVRELREARAEVERLRAEVWADVAALLNDRAQMFEDEGRPVLTRELRGLANAYRTYAEGVGIPSIQTLREKRRAAEAERDDLRARLANVEGERDWWKSRANDQIGKRIGALNWAAERIAPVDTECCASGSCEVCRPGTGGWGDR